MFTESLTDFISENGLSILNNNVKLFEKLSFKFSKEETALLMLIFSKREFIYQLKHRGKKQEDIAQSLSELYHFDYTYSSLLSKDLFTIFSDQQLETWSKNYKKGINEFLNSSFEIEDTVCCLWYPKNNYHCHLKCTLNYKLFVVVKDYKKTKEFIKSYIKNEFATKEKIISIFKKIINDDIEIDFTNYCQSDDYYEPCVEDYSEDILESFSEKYGLKIEILEWNGDTSDYISD